MHGRGPRLGVGALALLAVLMALPWASSALASSGVNPPVVTTGTAVNVTKTTAELTATVDATGPMPVTKCSFEYGISPGSSEASVPCSSLPGTGGGPVPVSAIATGLNPDTSYSFKIVATTEEGTGDGEPESFTTIANAPVATTGKAGEVKLTSALLEGTVKPEGVPSTCEFEWGTSRGSLTETAPCSPQPGSGTGAEAVTAALTKLAPNTTYYFKLVAHGEGGNGEGAEEEFTTPDGSRGDDRRSLGGAHAHRDAQRVCEPGRESRHELQVRIRDDQRRTETQSPGPLLRRIARCGPHAGGRVRWPSAN